MLLGDASRTENSQEVNMKTTQKHSDSEGCSLMLIFKISNLCFFPPPIIIACKRKRWDSVCPRLRALVPHLPPYFIIVIPPWEQAPDSKFRRKPKGSQINYYFCNHNLCHNLEKNNISKGKVRSNFKIWFNNCRLLGTFLWFWPVILTTMALSCLQWEWFYQQGFG